MSFERSKEKPQTQGFKTGFFLLPNQARTKTHLVVDGKLYCKTKPLRAGAEFVECANEARMKIVDCLHCIRKYIEKEP